MKVSKYNWIVNDEDEIVVYNGYTGAISCVDKTHKDYICLLLNSRNVDDDMDGKFIQINNKLIANGYIIDDDFDELFILEQLFNARKYSNRIDHVTVIPTYDCNFCCDYCFERNRKKANCGELIRDDVIEKIKGIAQANRSPLFQITFFGGEPLLAMDKCLRISSEAKEAVEKNNAKYNAFMVSNGYLLTE
jgi:uncharacterized protein